MNNFITGENEPWVNRCGSIVDTDNNMDGTGRKLGSLMENKN